MADIRTLARELVADIEQSGEGHREAHTLALLNAMKSAELIPEVPSYWFEEQGKPVPFETYTACEIALYDNLPMAKPREKQQMEERYSARKKRYFTSKTRFGGRIKFWSMQSKHFNPRQKAHYSFDLAYFGYDIIENVLKQCRLSKATALFAQVKDHETSKAAIFGIMRKPKGSYIDGHLAMTILDDNNSPESFVVFNREGNTLTGPYEFFGSNGEFLQKPCIATLRISRNGDLEGWTSDKD